MPQVTVGNFVGLPPGASQGTTPPVLDLLDVVAPGASSNPDVKACSNGSRFTNVNGSTGSTLFVKVAGAWVNLA